MTRSKHRRHAKRAGESVMIEDDAQLARAAEAFFAESLERERVSEPGAARFEPAAARFEPAAASRPGASLVQTLDDERDTRYAERGDDRESLRATGPDANRADDIQRPESRKGESRREAASAGPAVIIDGDAWRDVVQQEAARWQRHGGSVAVLAVRLAQKRPTLSTIDPSADDSPGSSDSLAAERYAVPLGDVLRHRARASDPVARVASDQFSILLLETDEAGASAYAERIRAICEPWVTAVPGDLVLRIGWAVPRVGDSFEAVAHGVSLPS